MFGKHLMAWRICLARCTFLALVIAGCLQTLPAARASHAGPTWQPAPDDLIGDANLGGVLGNDGRIYVVGGNTCTQDTVGCNGLESYDTRTHIWRQLPSMPSNHMYFSVATALGKIYVIGGGGYHFDDQVDTYTIATRKWGPATYVFPASGSGATRGKDGNIYVLAGSDLYQ